jgi:hypothetical protein
MQPHEAKSMIRESHTPRRAKLLKEPGCPVTDDELARLYRADADADEINGIASKLPPEARVELALFCYARAHLRDVGWRVAKICDPKSLRGAGSQGFALAQGQTEARPRLASKVTLPTAQNMRTLQSNFVQK